MYYRISLAGVHFRERVGTEGGGSDGRSGGEATVAVAVAARCWRRWRLRWWEARADDDACKAQLPIS